MFLTKKRALCSFHDKRVLLADGIPSLAYGHRDISTTLKDVKMVGDKKVMMGMEEADSWGSDRAGTGRNNYTGASSCKRGSRTPEHHWTASSST